MFVSCDWGTSHLRLLAVDDGATTILARFQSDDGVGRLAGLNRANGPQKSNIHAGDASPFEAVLERGLRQLTQCLGCPLGSAPVLISGMASSSIGWQELPYVGVPLSLDGANLVWRQLDGLGGQLAERRVILISGLRTATDCMRGEEIQALGLFQLPVAHGLSERALVIVPGTHSKHIKVLAGQICQFRTFMTGELFDVLGTHSVLRHSLADAPSPSPDQNAESPAAFRAGVACAAELGLSAALFRVRTRQLLDRARVTSNRSFLSGVLVGGELAHLRLDRLSGQPILLCGSPPLDELYADALDVLKLARQSIIVPPQAVERLSALGQALLLRRVAGA